MNQIIQKKKCNGFHKKKKKLSRETVFNIDVSMFYEIMVILVLSVVLLLKVGYIYAFNSLILLP